MPKFDLVVSTEVLHGSEKRQEQTKAARARAEKLSAIASLVK